MTSNTSTTGRPSIRESSTRKRALCLVCLALTGASSSSSSSAHAFVSVPSRHRGSCATRNIGSDNRGYNAVTSLGEASNEGGEQAISTAPTLNGKMVLPMKAMAAGLKGHKVPAVYAVLNSNYKRGSGEGWEHCEHVSITRDLAADLSHFADTKGAKSTAHVRALSFSYPQKSTMEDFAAGWRLKVDEAEGTGGGKGPKWAIGDAAVAATAADTSTETTDAATDALIEAAALRGRLSETTDGYPDDGDDDFDEDDMDEDDLDDMMQMAELGRMAETPALGLGLGLTTDAPELGLGLMAETRMGLAEARGMPTPDYDVSSTEIVSPFKNIDADGGVNISDDPDLHFTNDDGEPLELNVENVDKVLNEVRPYLISDGGNVSVRNVDAETGNVYLELEGACGSCASSTVTMKMGIERVLKENFDGIGEVVQVDPEDELEGGDPKELTLEAVQVEVKRISTAILAMGGVVRVKSVDPIGVVELEFRGPNKVKQGLELALLDVEFVKHVKFISIEE